MDKLKIFIVEDDIWFGELMEYHIALNPEYEVVRFTTGEDCIKNLYQKPMAITLDYILPDMSGKEVLKKIKQSNPDIPVVIVSGQKDISTALNILKEGVFDYIIKDEDTNTKLWNTLKNIREKHEMQDEISKLKEEIGKKYKFDKLIIGKSPEINKVFDLMGKALKTNITVSITGETGTGKELVAKVLHHNSLRSKSPFVTVNIPAIPKELIESELFGYEKGAFTGADSLKIGKFEYANKGSIFLDEISEMDVNLQAKFLRVLQEKEFTRIGGNTTIKTDVRIISATNKNLKEEVKKGNFRQDLYYRLLGLSIELPPLRNRISDILILAKHFIKDFCKENKLKDLTLSEEAREKLIAYSFPGNIRELKSVVELACVMASSNSIEAEDITFDSIDTLSDLLHKETTLKEYNQTIIKHFLEKYNNNISEVAKMLDIGKSTLWRMKKYGEI